MHIRIEAGAHGLRELLEEGVLVRVDAEDVLADILGLVHVLDDQIVLAERRRRDGFLVGVLAVNDGRHLLRHLLIHDVPHLRDPRARGVDRRHSQLVEVLHLRQRRAERRQNHDVALLDALEVLAGGSLFHEFHARVLEHLVHARIVQEFVRDVLLLVRKLLHRCQRKFDRPHRAPAQPVLLGEAERHGAVAFALRHLEELRFQFLQKRRLHRAQHPPIDRFLLLQKRRLVPQKVLTPHNSPPLLPLRRHRLGLQCRRRCRLVLRRRRRRRPQRL
mmetsp:Transcript_13639/g.41212  ORF Transcript_13639/g.41212 Transcript_13639/m.41212 type:complete len:275 (+) Transcript_13639:713-1537(+)